MIFFLSRASVVEVVCVSVEGEFNFLNNFFLLKKLFFQVLKVQFGLGVYFFFRFVFSFGFCLGSKIGLVDFSKLIFFDEWLYTKGINSVYQDLVKKRVELLKRMNSYRGLRHKQCLPVRGQRTRTNAQTMKKSRRFFK